MPFQIALEEELGDAGWDTRSILLRELRVMSCLGCFKCWDTTPGLCIQQKDEAQGVVEKVIQSELLVFLTPLTFGGYSSDLKKIIERFLGLLQPGVTTKTGESHHLKRYDRYPSLLACAVTEAWDDEEVTIFSRLIDRHSLNFYPPKHKAGVFVAGEDKNKTREKIQSLLQGMEPGR